MCLAVKEVYKIKDYSTHTHKDTHTDTHLAAILVLSLDSVPVQERASGIEIVHTPECTNW